MMVSLSLFRCAVISSIPARVSSTYTCNDMEGRYVNLFIPGDSKFLTLCEVEVYGEGVIKQADLVFWETGWEHLAIY